MCWDEISLNTNSKNAEVVHNPNFFISNFIFSIHIINSEENSERKMQRLVAITLKLILILKLSLSLVCDGDFQAHTLVHDIYGDAYRFLTSNSSCWFNLYGGVVEIKLKVNPRTTNMV